jgi:hypothetical protein
VYPNPQDVLPLPPHPDLEQYRRRARDLVKACTSSEPDALTQWASRWIHDLHRLYSGEAAADRRQLEHYAAQLATFARKRMTEADGALTQAQFVIARAHGFLSWARFARHLGALERAANATSAFEQAADAIVTGDLNALAGLLAENPDLVRERSEREHRATLLHYVSANGVENFRQRTPPNIVVLAERLLDAGAEVDAEADVYGGGATTLDLVLTSAHPRKAGVQNQLADRLIGRGAKLGHRAVRSCLANGCPEAALHLVTRHGGQVDLEDAAGLGLLERVRSFLQAPGASFTDAELVEALRMASWYGQVEVVDFLLNHGIAVDARDETEGHTALHIAAYQGSPALVELLLRRGAAVNLNDRKYGTPPVVWALHAWLVDQRDAGEYPAVLRLLSAAGAEVKREWLDDDRIRAEPGLLAALQAH